MLLDQLDQLGAPFDLAFFFADQVNHRLIQQIAELIDRRQFAAALESWIDRQHPPPAHRRQQQQVSQILREHHHRVRFGRFGHFAANFPLQAREHQPLQSVAGTAAQEFHVRMIGRRKQRSSVSCDQRRFVGFDFHPQHLRPLAAIDRQHTVRRNFVQRLFELEVIAELFPLLLGDFGFRARPIGRFS